MKHIEILLQTFAYFAHSPWQHLEFTKLAEVMETKGNKLVHNVKTRWILILNLVKKVLTKYKTLLVKIGYG